MFWSEGQKTRKLSQSLLTAGFESTVKKNLKFYSFQGPFEPKLSRFKEYTEKEALNQNYNKIYFSYYIKTSK